LWFDPNDTASYQNKGDVLADRGKYEEALLAYEQALQLDPGKAMIYNNKGVALADLGKYEEALVAYEQALQLDPNQALAFTAKGQPWLTLKEMKRPSRLLKRLLVWTLIMSKLSQTRGCFLRN
jgi:tetratricopeptide (TPR) repeat protein